MEILENALFYIIIFFVATTVIAVIKELIEKAVSKNSSSTSTPPITNSATKKETYRLSDFNDLFALVLDNTLKFVDAYLAERPGEWIFITISNYSEKGEFSTDGYKYYEEFVLFQVNVGSWYEGILNRNKDVKEYMETIYSYDPSEYVFTYKMRIGESTNCIIPRDIVKKKFFDCLDAYEKTHPDRKLTRTSFGIHHRWNLDN